MWLLALGEHSQILLFLGFHVWIRQACCRLDSTHCHYGEARQEKKLLNDIGMVRFV